MKIYDPERASQYIATAKEFVNSSHRWHHAKPCAISAIAEYLANLNGDTIYNVYRDIHSEA